MRNLILHHHFFKAAGTSVDGILRGHFGSRWAKQEFRPLPLPEGNAHEIVDWIIANPHVSVLSTHTARAPMPEIPNVKITSFALLRDPIERIKSAYIFERNQKNTSFGSVLAKHTTFEGYVRSRQALPNDAQCKNFQTRRLSTMAASGGSEFEKAKATLENLSVTGTVCNFSGAMSRLAGKIKNFEPDFKFEEVHLNRSSPADLELNFGAEFNDLLIATNKDDLKLIEIIKSTY